MGAMGEEGYWALVFPILILMLEQYEEDIPEDNFNTSTNFKCFKFKEIVSIDDKFNDDLQEDQMCKLYTMTQAYGS